MALARLAPSFQKKHPDHNRWQGDVSHPELRGIVPRAVEALGEGIAADDSGGEYEVRTPA